MANSLCCCKANVDLDVGRTLFSVWIRQRLHEWNREYLGEEFRQIEKAADTFPSHLFFRKHLESSSPTDYTRSTNVKEYWATASMAFGKVVPPVTYWLPSYNPGRLHSISMEKHSCSRLLAQKSSIEFRTKVNSLPVALAANFVTPTVRELALTFVAAALTNFLAIRFLIEDPPVDDLMDEPIFTGRLGCDRL
ncbi:unnamed protein product [Echinostoma caproni]|uniref:Anoctamin n=1 Tax=Echinostoma caproni TaxID=27848 RepID=A0A183ASF5_9TREM|nr:unnamed protein product [Echinostoma caproni]